MWPNQPLGRNIAGTAEVVRKITRKDIIDYVSTFYQPKNMIIAVSGAYSNTRLNALIKKYWSKIGAPKWPAWKKVEEKQRRPEMAIQNKKTEQYHIALAFRSHDYNHPDYVPQIVLASILGGGMSSRLFLEIRERKGWAYYVRSSAGNYQDTGAFVIQAGVRRDALAAVLKTLMAELKKIKKTLVSGKELAKVKEYLKGSMTLSLEDSDSLLSWYLDQVAFRRKILQPEAAFRLIDSVTAEKVRKVAQDIFQEKKMNLAIVGKAGNPAGIKKLLRV
ncbi:insulinase family protein [bacterium]|nr:MAG: insulinase family protein [bacterium]